LHSSVSFLLFGLSTAPVPLSGPVELAQLTIEQRVIIRVPLARPSGRVAEAAPPRIEWEEKKGPKCIALRSIQRATITTGSGVDLILLDTKRYRAKLERGCRSADFWSGFYVEPSKDGSLCAGRDTIQARTGVACEIDGFKKLVEQEE
jgi:hypothetical protein